MKQRLLFLSLVVMLLGVGIDGWGQILTFEFSALAGSEVSATSNSNNANLTSSTITRGAGLTASGNGGRFNATSWALTSIANAVSGNDYMEFTITPNSGYQFSVSSIVVQWQRSATGNTAISLRSSVDSYASDLDGVKNVTDNTSTQSFTWTFAQANSTSAVTYRLYSYAEADGGSGGPGDGAGNDIVVNGTVSESGELSSPPSLTSDATSNTVDNEIDITFTTNATWQNAVSAVKIGGTALTVTTDYVLSDGNLKLKPSGGNSLLTTSGSKSVTVEATGYTVASVTQVINAGIVTGNSTATINSALGLNTTRTVTCTAKDQYNNLVSGYTFQWNATIYDANATTDESYIIDGSAYTASASNVNLISVTNASGVATFDITIPAAVDASDGLSVQVQLADPYYIGSSFDYFKATPHITVTGTDPGSADFQQGTSNNVLYRFQVDVSNDVSNLTEVIFSSWGSYVAADILASGFKLWYSTDNTIGGDTELSSLSSSSTGTGESLSFTGFDQQFAIGTAYLFITVNIASDATPLNNITGYSSQAQYLTFSGSPNYSGSSLDLGNFHTIVAGPTVLQAGDIAIVEFISTNPDKFSFVTFVDLSPNTLINFTDNGYSDNTTVRTGEGFLIYTAPSLISAGTVVSWYNAMTISGTGWSSNAPSNFALAAGDQLFAYQGTWGSGHSLIYGLNSGNSGWITSGSATSNTSYLPSTLTNGVNAAFFTSENGNYTLLQSGTMNAIKSIIANGGSQWNQSGSSIATPSWNFTFSNSTTLNANVNVVNLLIDVSESITIPTNINLTTTGNLTNSAGASGLMIESDASGTGSLIHNSNNIAATVERYIPGVSNAWHLLGSPVAAQGISGDWIAGNYDFYAYDEATATWLNQKVGANNINSFTPGRGYLVAYETTAQTKAFSGNLNNGDVSVGVTISGSAPYTGANLLANPYASGIDWNTATRTLFADNFAYVYDQTAGGGAGAFSQIDGGSGNAWIAPHQGFFVVAQSAGTFTFTNSMREHGGTFTKNTTAADDMLRLRLSGDTYFDETSLRVKAGTSALRDRDDAQKFFSYNLQAPQLYSLSEDGMQLMLNSHPQISQETSIGLGMVIPAEGAYTISMEAAMGQFAGQTLYLEDLQLGTSHNLSTNGAYAFVAQPSDNPNRFVLHFGAVGISEQPASATLKAYVVGAQLFFPLQGEATLEIVDLQGRVLQQSKVSGQGLASQPLQLPSGVYVVRLTSGLSAQTAKVIVK